MKKAFLLALLTVISASISAFALPAGDVKWYNLKDGTAKAKTEKKPMIVDFFYSKECPRCAKLEQDIYKNPDIARKINADFIPIFIDLTKRLSRDEEALGNTYDYKNDCLMLFLDSDMSIIKDPSGKKMCFVDNIEAGAFNSYLDMIRGQMKK